MCFLLIIWTNFQTCKDHIVSQQFFGTKFFASKKFGYGKKLPPPPPNGLPPFFHGFLKKQKPFPMPPSGMV